MHSMNEQLEWVGGCVEAPAYITEGEPYRPEMIVWLEPVNQVALSFAILDRGSSSPSLSETLHQTMAKPMVGPPRRPSRVRLSDPAQVEELRATLGEDVDIVCAPTPELDAFIALMQSEMAAGPEAASYIDHGRLSAAAVHDLFIAAQQLYKAAPWKRAGDHQTLRLDISALGVEGACISVIGALGESLGFLVFPSLRAYDTFRSAALASQGRDIPEFGTGFLGLDFERGANLPALLRREVATHGWPVANANAYPWPKHVDHDCTERPLSERDLRILTVTARGLVSFFTQHGHIFALDAPPTAKTTCTVEDISVSLTAPYEALPADRRDMPSGRIGKIGRNDLCPCGSGKKYKKCHLLVQDASHNVAAARMALHTQDRELVTLMLGFAEERFGQTFFDHVHEAFGNNEEAASLWGHWAVYHACIQGRPVADWFLEERGGRLTAAERDWIAAQQAAWLGMWEVTDVTPGESLTLQDLLTGATRQVREVSASQFLVSRDVVLGRIVDQGKQSLLCGMHQRSLPPLAAADVLQQVRTRLRLKKAIPPERLRSETIGCYILARWDQTIARLLEQAKTPPRLRNTDGDDLLATVDHFIIQEAGRAAVLAKLASIDGADVDDGDAPGTNTCVLTRADSAGAARGRTILGIARIAATGLSLETNSQKRADALRCTIEAACGPLIRHRGREHSDPTSPLVQSSLRGTSEALDTPEIHAFIRQHKEQHYATWADTALPALNGKTPREAVKTAAGKTRVDALLKDMENHENRMSPQGSRMSFVELRGALGLPL